MGEHRLYNLACEYAEQGLKLLWFRLDKKPGPSWSTESTQNKDILKTWFYNLEPGQRRIGIKTGQDSHGVIVIDIDVNKKDKITGQIFDCRTVDEKIEYIGETYGILPDTVRVYTPSGGCHLYYIADRPVATLKKIFPGDSIDIDSRGDGGVIVAPDEVDYITDGEFSVKNMSPLPEWLYDIIARRNPLTRSKTQYTGDIPLIPEMEKAISDALMFMDFSDRDQWIKYGHAVKSLNSEDGKKLWCEWGQQYSGYDPDYTDKTWESLNPSEINIATLFYDAKEKGYEPEEISTDIIIKEQELQSKTDKPRFNLKSKKDIFAPREPVKWLVEDLIIESSLCMITGDAGSGKTWTALDLAVCISEGAEWLGRKIIQGRVLILDEESGDNRLAKRLQKIIKGHEGQDENEIFYISMNEADIRNALDLYELEKIIIENNIRFVVIDSLMEVILGADENSVKDVSPALKKLKQIIEHTGVTFLIIHHNDKNDKGYRGTTAIKGAVDLLFEVKKAEGSDVLKFKTVKIRDGEPLTFNAKMIFTDFSFNLELSTEKEKKLRREFSALKIKILKYISENPGCKTDDIVKNIPGSLDKTVINKLGELFNEQFLDKEICQGTKFKNAWTINSDRHFDVKMVIEKGFLTENSSIEVIEND